MVVRETFHLSAIVLIGVPLSINVFISSKSRLLNFSGRPPNLPRAHAAARPTAERSRIRFRSNSANAANKWNINWLVELNLSIVIFSCKLWKLTPWLFNRLTIVIKSSIFRPSRSNRHTTSVSPEWTNSIAVSNLGRLLYSPLVCPVIAFKQLNFSRLSSCKSKFYIPAALRVYPTFKKSPSFCISLYLNFYPGWLIGHRICHGFMELYFRSFREKSY